MCEKHDPEPAERKKGPREKALERDRKAAFVLDDFASQLVRGRPALDAALGEICLRLDEGDLFVELHRAKKTDFAHEDLGISSGSFRNLLSLASGLRARPVLKQAVMAGLVSTLKALIVMPLAEGEQEEAFTAAAMEMTGDELKALVKAGGGEVADDSTYSLDLLKYWMSPEQQDICDAAVSLAKELEGYDAPRWKLVERIARDWLARERAAVAGAETGEESGEDEEADSEKPGPSAEERRTYAKWLEQMVSRKDEVHRQLKVLFEAHEIVEQEESPEGQNALGLKALAQKLVRRRESFDEPLGRVLYQLTGGDFMWLLGFSSFGEYCRERLGISESTARQRIRLERRMQDLPPLRQALISGTLNYTKAIEVSRHATRRDVEERIRDAAGTTYQQTKQVADEEEDRKDRERGERKVRSPRAAQEVILAANKDAREHFAQEGEEIDAAEAFIRLHSIFFEKWEKPLKRSEWRTAAEKGVMMRHGGLCAVPGCTRAAQHSHHIIFESDDGPPDAWNKLAVCWCHHALCIHRGTMTVRGRGGEHLVWVFKGRDGTNSDLVPCEKYDTWGNDDVRRRPPGSAG